MVRNSILARARLRWPVPVEMDFARGVGNRDAFFAQAAQNTLAQLVADAVLLGEFGDLVVECEAQRGFRSGFRAWGREPRCLLRAGGAEYACATGGGRCTAGRIRRSGS